MLAAAVRFLPAARSFVRQIIPPVIATLIAAVLIAGYNHAFSGHLVQPRLAAMHSEAGAAPVSNSVAVSKVPREAVPLAETVVETSIVTEHAVLPDRIFAKDEDREAGKDQTIKLATAEPAAPGAPRIAARKAEPQAVEPRPAEPRVHAAPAYTRPVAAAPLAPIVAPVAGAPVVVPVIVGQPTGQPLGQPWGPPMNQPVAQQPPPVITAKPMVTVPDRQQRPVVTYDPQAEQDFAPPPPPRQTVLGSVVETLKPSSIFARMREFGDKIEAAGNDILPSIRQ
jgi:hypothetical protein